MIDFGDGMTIDGLGFLSKHRDCSRSKAIPEFLKIARQIEERCNVGWSDAQLHHDAPHSNPSLKLIQNDGETPLSPEQRSLLARSRGWLRGNVEVTAGLVLASGRGVLRACKTWSPEGEIDCWLVIDSARHCGQVRRLDGRPIKTNGSETKAKTLKGSCIQWPVGIADIGSAKIILMMEGSSDFLAAHAFIAEILPAHGMLVTDVAVVAMLGATAKIHPKAISRLRDRTVIILADADEAGQKAMKAWMCSLHLGGVRVYALNLRLALGSSGKDLEDLYRKGLKQGVLHDIFDGIEELFQ